MSVWVSAHDRDMITLNKFLHLYRLKPSIHYGYFEILPWSRESRVVRSFLTSFRDWKSRYLFVSGSGWETMTNNLWGEVPWLLQKWEIPSLSAFLYLFVWPTVLTYHFLILQLVLQFLIVLSWKTVIKDEFKLLLSLPLQSNILTTW